ncbi:YhcN/YlaJ family sporulation lipoprotein [Lederbergia graminis]|uniref:YhcN/YlaJ family sporulation lipoprotein n=1 Tax=Lederbergia graminis TaxID=735518 RepID=A0ABW0LEZ0_9BACI
MKPRIFTTIILSSTLLFACNNNEQNEAGQNGIYHNNGSTINQNEQADDYNPNQTNTEQFGFVRQVKNPAQNDTNHLFVEQKKVNKRLNREETANNISKLLVTLPNVHDASVLVTDEEVLVAYIIQDTQPETRIKTARLVKAMASNMVADWYHVYLTDDPAIRQDVKNIASMNSFSRDKDETVKDTVNLMVERSPQGDKVLDKQWLDKNK